MPREKRGRYFCVCDKAVLDLSLHSKEETRKIPEVNQQHLTCVSYLRDKHGDILHLEDLTRIAGVLTALTVLLLFFIILYLSLNSSSALGYLIPSETIAIADQDEPGSYSADNDDSDIKCTPSRNYNYQQDYSLYQARVYNRHQTFFTSKLLLPPSTVQLELL